MFHHERHEGSQYETAAAVSAHVSTAGSGFANAEESANSCLLELGW
jgi:hypothetical protein